MRIRAVCLLAVFLLAAGLPPGPTGAAELEELIQVCGSCHGEDGRPVEPDIPIIWGQEFYYLYVQLKDYKAGRRDNEIMSGIAADLSKEEMQAVAQYFSEQTWPRYGFDVSDEEVTVGETATAAGFCTQCHLGQYQGNSRIPRLAGQQPGYLRRTMLDFKNKIRLNSAAKGTLIGGYDNAEIDAMADYLAAY